MKQEDRKSTCGCCCVVSSNKPSTWLDVRMLITRIIITNVFTDFSERNKTINCFLNSCRGIERGIEYSFLFRKALGSSLSLFSRQPIIYQMRRDFSPRQPRKWRRSLLWVCLSIQSRHTLTVADDCGAIVTLCIVSMLLTVQSLLPCC